PTENSMNTPVEARGGESARSAVSVVPEAPRLPKVRASRGANGRRPGVRRPTARIDPECRVARAGPARAWTPWGAPQPLRPAPADRRRRTAGDGTSARSAGRIREP